MIASAAWFTAEHCGFIDCDGRSQNQRSPDLASAANVAALAARPLKYYPRMTTEARLCLCAASLAMRAAGWLESASREIGTVAAGYAGCIQADKQYFRDYVANGRTIGRANLFIYTLPTSVLGEIAIPLHLTGPTMHLQADDRPVAAILRHAEQLVTDHEADAMLALWSDLQAAVCFAVDSATTHGNPALALQSFETTPLELASHLAAMTIREPQIQ